MLDEIIAAQPLSAWAERFEREGVWWAPAQTPAEVVEDPQFLANGGFVEIAGGAAGTQRSVNGPVTFSDVPGGRTCRFPASGSTPTRCSGSSPTPGRRPSTGAALAPGSGQQAPRDHQPLDLVGSLADDHEGASR